MGGGDLVRGGRVLLLVCSAAAVVSFVVRKKKKKAKFQEVGGGWLWFGQAARLHDVGRIPDVFDSWAEEFGVCEFTLMGQKYLLLADLEAVRALSKLRPRRVQRVKSGRDAIDSVVSGVFSAELPAWTVERRLMTPAFNHANLSKFLPTLDFLGERLVKAVKKKKKTVTNNGVVDASALSAAYTSDAIGFLSFGQDFGSLRDDGSTVKALFDNVLKTINDRSYSFLHLWKIPILGDYLDGAGKLRQSLHTLIEKVIKGKKQGDSTILDRMLAANLLESQKLSDERLAGNVATVYVAGTDTTASTLAWMLYALATHQDFQEEARREAKFLSEEKKHSLPDLLAKMPLLRSLFWETLRLRGPAPMLVFCNEHEPITVLGRTLEPMEYAIVVPLRFLGTRPEAGGPTFDPKRWVSHGTFKTFTAMPFGFGVRTCPAKDLAEIEACLACAHLLKAFQHINFIDDHGHPQPTFRFTQQPDRPIRLAFS